MGREVKRVALDFDWPIGRVWPGYYLSICNEMDGNCELCRKFGELAGIKMPYDCPDMQIEPPSGPGWQMWETVSEGSPVSPVCKSSEDLAHWLTENIGERDITHGTSYDTWLKMIHVGWAPSLIINNTDGQVSVKTGVGAVSEPGADMAKEKK